MIPDERTASGWRTSESLIRGRREPVEPPSCCRFSERIERCRSRAAPPELDSHSDSGTHADEAYWAVEGAELRRLDRSRLLSEAGAAVEADTEAGWSAAGVPDGAPRRPSICIHASGGTPVPAASAPSAVVSLSSWLICEQTSSSFSAEVLSCL